jgi:alkanesulfonate monooxygenase SsuD/methylene tetrahydromethanopterin reductase-like flavin-dependent oxidoreductase (luciferase family)
MGTAGENFYNDALARQGFGDDVEAVRRLWAAGDRDAAAARVPIEIGFGTNLIGPPATVKQRLVDYERAGVTTLRINLNRPFDRLVAELELLLDLTVQAGRDITDITTPGATP